MRLMSSFGYFTSEFISGALMGTENGGKSFLEGNLAPKSTALLLFCVGVVVTKISVIFDVIKVVGLYTL